MIVCIAEKPSVAKEIADVLGAKTRREGYIEGNGYQVTWTFGHLCTLKEPHDYTPQWKSWSLGSLPMIPPRFGIKLIDDKGIERQFGIVKELMQDRFQGRLHLLERAGKLGLGTAYITGFKWAIEHKYDYIFEMDADFSHNPDDLLKLYDACANQGADVAIGSRYVTGVNVVNWPMGRVLMSYFASKYVRFVLGVDIHDTTAGFKCYRREVLETIELEEDILALLEIINLDLEREPKWKTMLNKFSFSSKSDKKED